MSKITFNKVSGDQFTAENIDEIKSVVNENDDTLIAITEKIANLNSSGEFSDPTKLKRGDSNVGADLTAIENFLDSGFIYKGVATPATNPGTPTGKVFYIATTAGTYTNFGGAVILTNGIYTLSYTTTWLLSNMLSINDAISESKITVMSSDGVNDINNRLLVQINQRIKLTTGGYWNAVNGHVVIGYADTYNRFARLRVTDGDVLKIKTQGKYAARAYFVTDASLAVLQTADENNLFSTYDITIPANGYYLFVNCASSSIDLFEMYFKNTLNENISKLENDILNIENDIRNIPTDLNAITVKSGKRNIISPNFIDGYIKYTDGTYFTYSEDGKYKADINYYEIIDTHTYIYNGTLVGNIDEAGIAFYNESKVFISGVNTTPALGVLVLPSGARYFRISDYKGNADHSGVTLIDSISGELDNEITGIKADIIELQENLGTSESDVPLIFVTGYIDHTTGVYHYYNDANKFKADTRYIEIEAGAQYKYTGVFFADAGIAYYNNSYVYMSGTNAIASDDILTPPTGAKYFRLSSYNVSGVHTGATLSKQFLGVFMSEINKLKQRNVIACTGDSVTEGMATNGLHTADYGKSPYPARLFTLLVDNGYDYIVKNYGHGGERTPDICARLGGIATYITEDITIPANNTAQSLGTAVIVNGRATATKLAIYDSDGNGVDYNVFLTQTQTDTNPCYIDGIAYNLAVNGNAMTIAKVVNDNKETIIKAGTPFFTNNNRNALVNIIYGGINDSASLTLEKYISRNRACGQANGGKYIIIGCTHPIWNDWADITASDKYAYYLRKCREAFGFHFLDLYDMFFRHAVDYALSAGYLSSKTPEQITAIRANMALKIMDGAFTYDGIDVDVHLNETGYHVIGMLLFDLLRRLNYI